MIELEIIKIMFGTVTMKKTCSWNPRLSRTERHGSAEPSLTTTDK